VVLEFEEEVMSLLSEDGSNVRPEEATLAGQNGTLGLLLDMEMPIVVRFGSTRMPLRDLLQIDTGSVIDLDPAPDRSVELLINGRLIARGEAVAVRGNYAVRIAEIAPSGAGFVSALARGGQPDAETREN
jgi:flagellar motor switch protein FliN/FliY